MRAIQRVLPEARFIHIIRDGRDVALSLFKLNWGPARSPRRPSCGWSGSRGRAGRRRTWTTTSRSTTRTCVTDTEAMLRRVCEFIELDYDPAMLDYHERAEERLKEKARDLPRKPPGTARRARMR